MKSERRHELQQNELANYLGHINRAIEPYSRIIAVVVGALILGSIALLLYNSKTTGEQSDATLQLIQAVSSQDAEVLAKVGDDFPKTAAGAWSRLYQGNEYLAEGIRDLFNNRSNAEDVLDLAIKTYQQALSASDDPLLQSRANFGIARAAESRGDLDDAIAAYKKCIEANESEAMVKKAQERIDSLSSPETKGFLAWFADQDFTPADPSLPPSLPSGTTLPDLPDLTLPPIGGAGGEKDLPEGIEMPADTAADKTEAGGADAKTPADSSGDAAKEGDTAEKTGTDADENATEPAATEPAATEPSATEPAATEPAATEPAATEPETPAGEDAPDKESESVEKPEPAASDADGPATDAGESEQE